MSNDPFDCFGGDDSDEDDGDVKESISQKTGEPLLRDADNGILAFHAGTERALLHFVQQNISEREEPSPEAVLACVDDFCLQRHWMMHVGKEKGGHVERFVEECCTANEERNEPFMVVELGTYCGYSSILLAKTLKKLGCEFKIYSVEVVETHVEVATKLIELAGLSECIQILTLNPYKESLSALLRRSIGAKDIDLLFIDHDKDLYLADLQQLEENKFVRKGCHVAADNVVFAKIEAYRTYVGKLAEKGIVRTRLVDSWLEYCEPDQNGDPARTEMMKDGLELSVYLSDPVGATES